MLKRRRYTVTGSVQGVGFRPFIYRLAKSHQLVGTVKNSTEGVQIDVQGQESSLFAFQQDLILSAPPRARISSILEEEAPLAPFSDFSIQESAHTSSVDLAILPDTALCLECRKELFDPSNRRYRYPFIHCTNCGPRFSLFVAMPFDRMRTSMHAFPMCQACQDEYNDPENRRFFSQTTCCQNCGPKLSLLNREKQLIATQDMALEMTIRALQEGHIVALKNTGGYLLLADATNEDVAQELRRRKRRAKKPFALLMDSVQSIRKVAQVTQAHEDVLSSPMAPIVLMQKKENHSIAPSVAPVGPYYGMMLPHTPLMVLLLEALQLPLIATSGNLSSRSICLTEEEAFNELHTIADLFLVHNRTIHHRLDDSLVQIIQNGPVVLRRARGYIPFTLPLEQERSSMLGTGGHMKNSFAMLKDNTLYGSQHMGDLEEHTCYSAYVQEIESWKTLLGLTPTQLVGDTHPGYATTFYLHSQSNETKRTIQHHEAHLFSCMADNNTLQDTCLGFTWDGTGYGTDETVWGGETFLYEKKTICRVATLFPFHLPGGEKAIQEPRRSALGLIHALQLTKALDLSFLFNGEEELLLTKVLNNQINSPLCSSMGRLFDGVSALLGGPSVASFEGEAALWLEALAMKAPPSLSNYDLSLTRTGDLWMLDWRNMVEKIYEDKEKGVPIETISASFHLALVDALVALSNQMGQKNILLSGGVMQNSFLLEHAIAKLKEAGFHPFWHHDLPPNDGGLAIGQIVRASLCV